jgi:hypothetical protein
VGGMILIFSPLTWCLLFREPPADDRGSVFLLIDPRRPSGTAFDPIRKGRMRICVNSFQGNSPILVLVWRTHSSESEYLYLYNYPAICQ